MEHEPGPEEVASPEEAAHFMDVSQEMMNNPESFGIDKNGPNYRASESEIVVSAGGENLERGDAKLRIARVFYKQDFSGNRRQTDEISISAELRGVAEAQVLVVNGHVDAATYKDIQSDKTAHNQEAVDLATTVVDQAAETLRVT